MLLITMVLGPACMFLLYVLFQFRREVAQPARKYPGRPARVVTLVTTPASRPEDAVVGPPGGSVEFGLKQPAVGRDLSGCGQAPDQRRRSVGVPQMRDLVFVICTVVFFMVSIAYVWACDRLK